jgi:hypothetical protein
MKLESYEINARLKYNWYELNYKHYDKKLVRVYKRQKV